MSKTVRQMERQTKRQKRGRKPTSMLTKLASFALNTGGRMEIDRLKSRKKRRMEAVET